MVIEPGVYQGTEVTSAPDGYWKAERESEAVGQCTDCSQYESPTDATAQWACPRLLPKADDASECQKAGNDVGTNSGGLEQCLADQGT